MQSHLGKSKGTVYSSFVRCVCCVILQDKKVFHLINSPDATITNFNIGLSNIQLHRYEDAIKYLLDGYKFNKAGGFPYNIGKSYEALGQGENALKYYIESAEIRYDQLGADHAATIDARDEAVKLASKLDRRSDLPDWFLDVGHGE